ncbi:MAG: acylglycerol kinase family protein [Myxococcales bacterium]|nr:acylglycerol kinase family protein [Myxococcales bacterium]MDH5565112.1 acylglycerol kinase family protein [Myxococcales bacterium]
MRIGVVNNLRAGQSRRCVSKLLALLARYPDVRHIETESAHALPEALAALLHERVELLVLNGGDGTLQHALTALLSNPDLEKPPWVAPLRGGRTNMAALDLGVRRDPVAALEHLLRSAAAGRLQELRVARPVLRVASSHSNEVHYGMFFGAGMIQRAIGLTHRIFPKGRSQGVLGASLVTTALIAKTLARPTHGILTPDKVEILLDGRAVPDGEFYLVIASSLQRLFLRLNPFWGEGPGGVRFTALASRVPRLAAAVPGILRGRPGAGVRQDSGYTSVNSHRIELRLACGFTVDGEIFPARADEHVTITADSRIHFVRA